ncbi:hypothetical protein D3C79_987240 [compost metagenome]
MNTLFMTGMFLGGTLGSSLAMLAWQQGNWVGVGGVGLVLALLALLLGVVSKGADPAAS